MDANTIQPDSEQINAIRARQRVLGRRLRRMYDDAAPEQMPDDFLTLLGMIDQKTPATARPAGRLVAELQSGIAQPKS